MNQKHVHSFNFPMFKLLQKYFSYFTCIHLFTYADHNIYTQNPQNTHADVSA